MSTNQTPAVRGDVAVNPATGQAVALDAPALELIGALDELADLTGRLTDYKRLLELELVRRVDETGRRTAIVDGCKLEVNAPTEDEYDVDDVTAALDPLVVAGAVPGRILEELIVYPPPAPPPPPRVDKRVINTLKSSDNTTLLRALAQARRRRNVNRTIKVKARPVDATAEEVDG